MESKVIAGQKKECCQKEENLFLHEKRHDLTVMKCKVCGCRHFEATLEPGKMGVEGSQMG